MAKKHAGCWLFKEEPAHYGFQDLERDGEATWDGVENALARKHLREIKAGDQVLYYHTGKERAIVGEMQVVAGAGPDPASDDPKAVVVKVRPVERWARPVTLDQIKKEPLLADWELVRIARLSVMPVTPAQWERVLKLRDG